jgi:hypothetical protein
VNNDFARRYLLARYQTGGVVVDLESGNYYRVNASAALVCDALRVGGDAERRIAAELGVSNAEAGEIAAEVVAGLEGSAVRGTPQGSYHFYPDQDGYVLRHSDRTVLHVDGASLAIRLPAGGEQPGESQLELYVRALAPKLLFQRGVTVLHASACVADGKLVAFAGVSGAGKTTTARAFAAAGARLVSEDLVVLGTGVRHAEVLTEGEPFVRAWARRIAAMLLADRDRSVPAIDLMGIANGSAARLDKILFLDRARRGGTDLEGRRIEESDALVTLMTHDFLGAKESGEWRRFFEAAVALVGVVQTEELSAPNGVEHLASAAARYTSTWTS